MKKSVGLFLALALGLVLAAPALAKTRVAVIPFDPSSLRGDWHSYWSGDDISRGVTDMFTTALFKSGKYTVIERAKLDAILAEQGLGASGAVNPATAARVGKILGVDAIFTGKITEFGVKESKFGASGINIGGTWLGGGVKTTEVKCALDVRMINTSTAALMAAESAADIASSSSISADFNWTSIDLGSNFDSTLIGQATRNAVGKIITKLTGGVGLTGKIASVSGNIVKINIGKGSDLAVGTVLEVVREGEAITDPDTGEVLEKEQTVIGEIKVTEVKENLSDCAITSGAGQIAKGDLVRLKK